MTKVLAGEVEGGGQEKWHLLKKWGNTCMIEGSRASRGGKESPQDETRQESRSQVMRDFWGQKVPKTSLEFRGPGNWDLGGTEIETNRLMSTVEVRRPGMGLGEQQGSGGTPQVSGRSNGVYVRGTLGDEDTGIRILNSIILSR